MSRALRPRRKTAVTWIDRTDNETERLFIALLGALGISAIAVPQFALPVIGVIVALLVVRSAQQRLR